MPFSRLAEVYRGNEDVSSGFVGDTTGGWVGSAVVGAVVGFVVGAVVGAVVGFVVGAVVAAAVCIEEGAWVTVGAEVTLELERVK